MADVLLKIERGSRFRHVVFRDAIGRRRAVNLAPRPRQTPPNPSAGECPRLEGDEAVFMHWLFREAGLDAETYRPETLRRRLGSCLRAVRAADISEARRRVVRDGEALADAMDAVLIGVTGFFRDAAVFDHLARAVLPALPRAARETGRPRVWSAGCSDGAELYSVAMLLSELKMLENAHLLGTDCRAEAVRRARAGEFETRALRDVPREWVDRYFEPSSPGVREPDTRQVCETLRRRAQWRRADVTRLCEPGSWDLILCRNLAMYLRPEVTGRLWVQLEWALRPGGFLVLGKAERPVGATRLELVVPCIYRKGRT